MHTGRLSGAATVCFCQASSQTNRFRISDRRKQLDACSRKTAARLPLGGAAAELWTTRGTPAAASDLQFDLHQELRE